MASPQVAGAAARYLAVHPGADPATVKADLLADAISQGDPAGFTGDTDGFAEPLLFVNGPAFNGNGDRTVADADLTPPPAPAVTATPRRVHGEPRLGPGPRPRIGNPVLPGPAGRRT